MFNVDFLLAKESSSLVRRRTTHTHEHSHLAANQQDGGKPLPQRAAQANSLSACCLRRQTRRLLPLLLARPTRQQRRRQWRQRPCRLWNGASGGGARRSSSAHFLGSSTALTVARRAAAARSDSRYSEQIFACAPTALGAAVDAARAPLGASRRRPIATGFPLRVRCLDR